MMNTSTRRALESTADRLRWIAENREQSADVLADLAKVTAAVEDWTRMHVLHARNEGASWAAIGAALGMSKQAAWERYGQQTA